MIIFGAGMAGLLAGNQLKRFGPEIHEAQKELPDNHGALLRFRSDSASQVTNMPFKKVKVSKGIIDHNERLVTSPNLQHSNMYSQKVSGKVMNRSINNLESVERYIAPDNFIPEMARGLDIHCGSPMTKEFLQERAKSDANLAPVISTVPMPIAMKLVDWTDMPKFDYKPIWSLVGEIERPLCDVYQTLYYPAPQSPQYRVSITGKTLIIEVSRDLDEVEQKQLKERIPLDFGINGAQISWKPLKHQEYGKLLPVEDDYLRKEFICYLTDKYKVYSLGRFATWRQLLLDDIVQDVTKIGSMIESRDNYARKMLHMGV